MTFPTRPAWARPAPPWIVLVRNPVTEHAHDRVFKAVDTQAEAEALRERLRAIGMHALVEFRG